MRKIFTTSGDVDRNAYVNWRIKRREHFQNLKVISDGYLLAAEILAQKCLEDNSDKKADILAFPMLFNLNQALEGYLKALSWELNILCEKGNKFIGGHDIKQLYGEFRARVLENEERTENFRTLLDELKPIEKYIDELYEHVNPNGVQNRNANMDFARYPFDTDWKEHFYVEKSYENFLFSIKAFHEFILEVKDVLPRLVDYYDERVQEKLTLKQENKETGGITNG
ncbi:MAG: hypothetical protein E7225_01035 [Clostridiales bacterium]|nr:hypothetical protein [Clostridiales bacterium]